MAVIKDDKTSQQKGIHQLLNANDDCIILNSKRLLSQMITHS